MKEKNRPRQKKITNLHTKKYNTISQNLITNNTSFSLFNKITVDNIYIYVYTLLVFSYMFLSMSTVYFYFRWQLPYN